MKTNIDMVNDAYKQLNESGVKALIDGVLIRYRRPKDSKKTDIVVNSVSISNTQLQRGVFNINVHVPNLVGVKFDEVADNQQPDINKLKAISDYIIPYFDSNWQYDYHTDIEPPVPIQDSDGTWFMNIRVNYYSSINNFKNI